MNFSGDARYRERSQEAGTVQVLPRLTAMLAPHDRVVLYRLDLDLTWHIARRARMTLPQAAQCVCQCRYGAALFSIVSASNFDGDGQGTFQTDGRLRVADCAEGLHRHGRYAVREG